MKKLGILLGSLLVVSTAATAKEVVPAPIVVEETPVKIIEREVIVYRDKEEGFKPSGSVDLQYRYYDRTEGSDTQWGNENNYGRLQLQGNVQMTENQKLDFRVRDYSSWDHSQAVQDQTGGTDVRLRYTINHGNIDTTRVGMKSFVEYRKKTSGSQHLEYQLKFEFADYMFNNDFIKTTKMEIAPRYKYTWNSAAIGDNSDNYYNTIGLYANWSNQLPWGFSTEFELDGLDYNMSGNNQMWRDGVDGNQRAKFDDKELHIGVNLYLYHDWNLAKFDNDRYSVDWHFEGGYDSYDWSNLDRYTPKSVDPSGNIIPKNNTTYNENEYSVYIQPSITLSYTANQNVMLYSQIGAEYRNWYYENTADAKQWRWQPFVTAGFKVSF